ncbi:MAG TPA: hypothetical protein EYP41_20200 [Anaerolineae bacterium]|nr:hypothetical protein [Anaerolineae bacterium]HIP73411.1 hypothetical protein [Anaerolineae bacterium]
MYETAASTWLSTDVREPFPCQYIYFLSGAQTALAGRVRRDGQMGLVDVQPERFGAMSISEIGSFGNHKKSAFYQRHLRPILRP